MKSFEKTFIKKFKKLTKDFYGIEYNFNLNFNNDNGTYFPTVDEFQSNNEGGLKRLEVITFDLAYIETVYSEKAMRPNFVFHDSIDDIDLERIKKLFSESSNISGQHILSILSDKLPSQMYAEYKDKIILNLAEDDKFFKIA